MNRGERTNQTKREPLINSNGEEGKAGNGVGNLTTNREDKGKPPKTKEEEGIRRRREKQ
jgi:hypothetical protein